MKIEALRRIVPADYPEAPEWFHRFADVLNDTLEQLTQLPQKNISTENLNEELREVTINDDQEFDLTFREIRGRPTVVSVVFVSGMRRHHPLQWQPLAGKQVRCKLKFLTDPGEPVLIRVLIRGQ